MFGRGYLGQRPGLGPAADLLSFASPKESRQRKGDPTCRVPSLRCGQPAMLGRGAVLRNSLRAWQRSVQTTAASQITKLRACCAALSPPHALRFSARPEGIEARYGPSLRSAWNGARSPAAGSAGLSTRKSTPPQAKAQPRPAPRRTNGRGAGQASERGGRTCGGHSRCPPSRSAQREERGGKARQRLRGES